MVAEKERQAQNGTATPAIEAPPFEDRLSPEMLAYHRQCQIRLADAQTMFIGAEERLKAAQGAWQSWVVSCVERYRLTGADSIDEEGRIVRGGPSL